MTQALIGSMNTANCNLRTS